MHRKIRTNGSCIVFHKSLQPTRCAILLVHIANTHRTKNYVNSQFVTLFSRLCIPNRFDSFDDRTCFNKTITAAVATTDGGGSSSSRLVVVCWTESISKLNGFIGFTRLYSDTDSDFNFSRPINFTSRKKNNVC